MATFSEFEKLWSELTAVKELWYAAGIVSESSHSNSGAANIVNSTTTATLFDILSSRFCAIF